MVLTGGETFATQEGFNNCAKKITHYRFSSVSHEDLSVSLYDTHNREREGGTWLWAEHSKPEENLSKNAIKKK